MAGIVDKFKRMWDAPDDGVLFNGETISMYDQVILEGDDLYDGKVIQ